MVVLPRIPATHQHRGELSSDFVWDGGDQGFPLLYLGKAVGNTGQDSQSERNQPTCSVILSFFFAANSRKRVLASVFLSFESCPLPPFSSFASLSIFCFSPPVTHFCPLMAGCSGAWCPLSLVHQDRSFFQSETCVICRSLTIHSRA